MAASAAAQEGANDAAAADHPAAPQLRGATLVSLTPIGPLPTVEVVECDPGPPLVGKPKYAALTDAELFAELHRAQKRLAGEIDLRKHERWQMTRNALEQPDERARREALKGAEDA